MITFTEQELLRNTDLMTKTMEANKTPPLKFDTYYKKYLTGKYGSEEFKPYEVKIAPSLEQLLVGISEPSKVIRIDKPITLDGVPIWRDNSSDGLILSGLGYKNGDSRFPSSLILGGTTSHGVLGGATGQGKSVALNSIITGICLKYPPWEARFIMADPKVVEFSRYASKKYFPHVDIIAATSDVNYTLSVLEYAISVMRFRNDAINASFGFQNIKDFREATGLVLPRLVIVVDEVQTAVRDAGSRAKDLERYFETAAALGRNTGVHLLIASQSPKGMSSDMLANMSIRMALGCDSSVSTHLIGNTEAVKNKGQVGKLIYNNSPSSDKSESFNQEFRVPYQDQESFDVLRDSLWDVANTLNVVDKITTFNEKLLVNHKLYENHIHSLRGKYSKKVFLGEPSIYLEDPENDKCLSIELVGEDLESMLLFSPRTMEIERLIRVVNSNFKVGDKTSKPPVIYCLSPVESWFSKFGLDEVPYKYICRESESEGISIVYTQICARKLLFDTDALVFGVGKKITEHRLFDSVIEELKKEGIEHSSTLTKKRILAGLQLLDTTSFQKLFELTNIVSSKDRDVVIRDQVVRLMAFFSTRENNQSRILKDSQVMIVPFILGIDTIFGWGRDRRAGEITKLKNILRFAAETNIFPVLTASVMADLSELKQDVRWFLMSGIKQNEAKHCGCDDYPSEDIATLAALYDTKERSLVRFKKVLLDGELMISK